MIRWPLPADTDVFAGLLARLNGVGKQRLDRIVPLIEEVRDDARIPVQTQGQLSQIVGPNGESVEVLQELVGQQRVGRQLTHHDQTQTVFTAFQAVFTQQLDNLLQDQIGNIKTGMQRKVAEALRELGFELDANQTTVRGKKQPRRWRRPATSDDLGSEEPSEVGQTANGEGDPSGQPRITTQEIDLKVGKLLEDGPGMVAASERGLNAPRPLVGSGFDVTSDDSRSERKKHTIPPLNLDCPF